MRTISPTHTLTAPRSGACRPLYRGIMRLVVPEPDLPVPTAVPSPTSGALARKPTPLAGHWALPSKRRALGAHPAWALGPASCGRGARLGAYRGRTQCLCALLLRFAGKLSGRPRAALPEARHGNAKRVWAKKIGLNAP